MDTLLYCILAVLVLLLVFLISPKGKGLIGELWVRVILGRDKENEKRVFHDYYLMANDRTVQIDHMLVCKKGVIVIETKNFSGRIYGNDNEQNWLQVLNYGKVKNKFYNPVKQNGTHCFFIKKIINEDKVPIISVVVFLKSNTKYINSSSVVGAEGLSKHINKFPDILTGAEIEKISKILMQNDVRKEVTNREHIKNIKRMKQNIDNNICPRCGSELVLRKGKFTEFYGCSKYPYCKFIKCETKKP
jgi:hypothetical protein